MSSSSSDNLQPPTEAMVEDDNDADVEDKRRGEEEEKDEAEEPQTPVWPPSKWTDKFTTPTRTHKRIVNAMPLSVTRIKSKEKGADGKPLPTKIGVYFSATPVAGQESKKGAWVQYTPPDLMGAADCVLVHATTWHLFERYNKFHGTSGIKLHCVPHPGADKVGLFVVKEVYLFPGIAINGEANARHRCLVCDNPAALACACEAVFYCSHQHMQMAFSSGMHTADFCDHKAQQLVVKDATRARQRIIAMQDLYEDEKEQARAAAAKREMDAAREQEQEQRDDEQDLARMNAASTQRRNKLKLESAKARIELGMEPDPNIDPNIVEQAALEVRAKMGGKK